MSKIFVLRAYALLSSRRSPLKFGDDNMIVIPISVVDELRRLNKESAEKAKIARDLLEYLNSFPIDQLLSKEGARQENGSSLRLAMNFYDEEVKVAGLREPELRTLLSLQLKAKSIGIRAESFKDEGFPRLSDQYTGREQVYASDTAIDSFYKNGFIRIDEIYQRDEVEFVENKFFTITSETGKSVLGKFKKGLIRKLDFDKTYPYGIFPKNVGQKFMIEALFDDECPLVVIKGNAGTGKTFCTLAAGLQETTENSKYSRILVTRSVTASEQYGFLPGDIEEKLSPYLAGIKDNLAILLKSDKKGRVEKNSSGKPEYENGNYFFERGIVQIQAIGFLRGRSIVDTYFIIDEVQNIEPNTIKSIVTRAAEGSKFIFLGDPTQIDNPELTERYNGLVYLSEKMKGNPLCAQVSLNENESVRSALALEAAKIL